MNLIYPLIKVFSTTFFPPFVLFFAVFSETSCSQNSDFSGLRERMVRTQIEARGISDPAVLKAMRKVERHRFVLPEYVAKAYGDFPLPIEEGQTISQPYIVALMTEELNLKRKDKVLEIGTGSGYQTAVLAEICDSVFTVEIFEKLAEKAGKRFVEMGYNHIFCKTGDGYEGWKEHAPFDAIIVTCSPSHIPQPLKDQLADGGRMIIPVGSYPGQTLVLLQKKNGKLRRTNVLPVRFVPMVDGKGDEY